ncbi:MAG: hypothetical protein LBU11_03550 [Zoogloeaceae bacterium]|jgi:hypothetical protein|nr:hypothetical protein [Zoogloeaceae bacterium]
MTMKASYCDGKRMERHPVELWAEAGFLCFRTPKGTHHIPAARVDIGKTLDGETCQLRFPGGALCEVAQGEELDALLEELGCRKTLLFRWRTQWRTHRRRTVCLALSLLLACSPVGQEWFFFTLFSGKWRMPKGWPEFSWRDWDRPTDPRELEAYEYAHSLKLPDSLPQPAPFSFARHLLSNRRTTAVAYFDHLCATEAGEYIFRTVDKVEGIYQMRAMPGMFDKVMTDRYAFEDPADWSHWEEEGSPTSFIGGPGNGFRYFESRRRPEDIAHPSTVEHWQITPWTGSGEAPYWRYHHFDYTHPKGHPYGYVQPVEQLESRYAYTWRGIRREADRKHGIAGGELIVLDRITGEILGVRRSFAIARESRGRLSWEFAYFCPKNMIYRSRGRVPEINKGGYPYGFVSQILNPVDFDPSKIRFN